MSDNDGIEVQCPHCEQRLRVPASAGGKQIHCPDCNGVIDVPTKTGITEEPPKPWSKPAEPKSDSYEEPKPWSQPTESKSDPYEEPARRSRYDDDDFAGDVRKKRGSSGGAWVMPPAICMLIVAVIGFFLATLNSVLAVAQDPPPLDPNAPPIVQEMMKGSHGPVAAVVQALFALMSATTIFGSIQMMRMKSWGLAVAVSIFSMINFASCCCILGLPFGVWALVVLMMPDVKESFT